QPGLRFSPRPRGGHGGPARPAQTAPCRARMPGAGEAGHEAQRRAPQAGGGSGDVRGARRRRDPHLRARGEAAAGPAVLTLLMWTLLQLADSAFPTGSFAHSAGLEAAAQAGEIDSVDGVRRFARDAVWQAGWGALPLVRGAYADPEALARLDARADAFPAQQVPTRASPTPGPAFLATAR